MVLCSFGCNQEAKHFFKNGKGCCDSSPNRCIAKRKHDSEKKKGEFKGKPYWDTENPIYNPWNKGKKDVLSIESRNKISEALKGKSKGVASTPEKEKERRSKISKTMKNNPLSGGLRKGSGFGKKGYYKGYWCDSTWELAWVIYNIDHNINFIRNTEGFEYIFNETKKLYYPDFIINDVFYEIKGRRNYESLDKQTKEKLHQFTKKLIVLFDEDMKQYINYCFSKYGKDLTKLYDK